METLSRGWQLAKMSLGVVKKDKEILVFPLLSLIFTGIVSASFIGGIFFMGSLYAFKTPVGIAALGAMYIIDYFVIVYFNVAVIGCAMIRFEGEDPTVSDGFRTSNQNLGSIVKWAIVAGTVGIILRLIKSRAKLVGKIAIIGGFAWSIATFFAVPVLIYEDKSLVESIKQSAHLLKNTWGETISGGLGLGLIFLLLGLLGTVPLILGIIIGGISDLIFGLIIAIPYWLILICVGSAADSTLHAALYRYAVTGKTASGFSKEFLTKPW